MRPSAQLNIETFILEIQPTRLDVAKCWLD
jgi:hypothetical protein